MSFSYAQIGIGTQNPNGTLDVTSSNLGVVIPRVSKATNVTAPDGTPPAEGTIVYDEAKDTFCIYANGRWNCNGISETNGSSNSTGYDEEDYTYLKASNTDPNDYFGNVSMSSDGLTVAIGAYYESSNATGINGDENNNLAFRAGAVYVFKNTAGVWTQEAYIKASNSQGDDQFGTSLSLSANGNTLIVGASNEDSNATGVNGDQSNNSLQNSGAAYVFERTGSTWTQTTYLKPLVASTYLQFGYAVTISANGNNLLISALLEDSNATGINGDATNTSTINSGAAYLFERTAGTWVQTNYIKSSNPDDYDFFGIDVAINAVGTIIAVGAQNESSNATGINGNEMDNSVFRSGAVYVFEKISGVWSQTAYVKASNTGSLDNFGAAISLNGTGNRLVVGASAEDSNSIGIYSIENNLGNNTGAAYLFEKNAGNWSQKAFIKPDVINNGDLFGVSVLMNQNGSAFFVGTTGEASNATGIGGYNTNNSSALSGAVYQFSFDGTNVTQSNYIKANNTGSGDTFGSSIHCNNFGTTLVVGARLEESNATGINGDGSNNNASNSGAAYIIDLN